MVESATLNISQEGLLQLVNNQLDGKNIIWTTDIDVELPIKVNQLGPGSEAPITLSQLFRETAKRQADKTALLVEKQSRIIAWSWTRYLQEVTSFAKAMHVVGVKERQSVNIMGHNSPEWAIAFHGCIQSNCVASGVYPTNNAEACFYQADHSEAGLVVVDSIEQLKKYQQQWNKLPNIKAIVVYSIDSIPAPYNKDQRIFCWEQFLNLGKQVPDCIIDEKVKRQRPGKCMCLIYTSGTTGNPKACMLSHDNAVWSVASALNYFSLGGEKYSEDDRVVSYLPLSHIAGLIFDILAPAKVGFKIYFARPDALQGTLVQSLQWARPTLFIAVPRIWEKMEEKLKEIGSSKGQLLTKVSTWAKTLGAQNVKNKAADISPTCQFQFANFLILNKIKQALGLDQCKGYLYGAAPIKQSTLDYFASLNIPIMGAYGMSETTALVSIQHNKKFNLSSVGCALPGTELKIDNPDEKGNGEIIFRGRNIMMGYLKNEQATKETIDKDGYLRSGDLGKIDSKEFLYITGRIKELIITAGGENIAPLIIEDAFKENCPPCSNIMVIGENQKFLSALITFKVEIDMAQGIPSNNLTSDARSFFKNQLGVEIKTSDEAVKNQKIKKFVEQAIQKTNSKVVSKAANIRKWILLPTDFSISGGELTPTLKLKRKVTEKKYQKFVDEMYSEAKL